MKISRAESRKGKDRKTRLQVLGVTVYGVDHTIGGQEAEERKNRGEEIRNDRRKVLR
jgi:hypothetical protein